MMIPCEAELWNDSASEGITRRIASREIVSKDRAGTGHLTFHGQGYLDAVQ